MLTDAGEFSGGAAIEIFYYGSFLSMHLPISGILPDLFVRVVVLLSLLWGQRSLKETFDWDEFKERFTTDFGDVAEKRYTLEQLLEYANRKFGKSLEDLIVQNQISWQRRQEYAERNHMHYQSETIEDSTHY